MTHLDQAIDAGCSLSFMCYASGLCYTSAHSLQQLHVCTFRKAVIGLVLVKELVLIDMFANIPVSALSMRPIPQLRADTAMYDLLKLFQTGRTHMVLLTTPPPGAKLLAAQTVGSAASRGDLAVNIEPQTIKRAAEEVCLSDACLCVTAALVHG